MRASSQILTVHQDLESSAPSPTRANSQTTLAAKQMLPWTLNISVSSGDASVLFISKEWNGRFGRIYRQSLSGRGKLEPLKHLRPCHLMLIRTKCTLLCMEDLNLQCFSTRTVGLPNSFPHLLKLNVAMNVLFGHLTLDTHKWLQKMGEPLSNFVHCFFFSHKVINKQSDISFCCNSSLCLDLLPCLFIVFYLWSQGFIWQWTRNLKDV